MNWINVKDRLPEESVDVLVYVYDGLGYYVSHGNYDNQREHAQWRECSRNLIKVTHWLPLPKPPDDTNECPLCGYYGA